MYGWIRPRKGVGLVAMLCTESSFFFLDPQTWINLEKIQNSLVGRSTAVRIWLRVSLFILLILKLQSEIWSQIGALEFLKHSSCFPLSSPPSLHPLTPACYKIRFRFKHENSWFQGDSNGIIFTVMLSIPAENRITQQRYRSIVSR